MSLKGDSACIYYLLIYIVIYYSLHPNLFVLFEKLKFLREDHLLSCLPYKNV